MRHVLSLLQIGLAAFFMHPSPEPNLGWCLEFCNTASKMATLWRERKEPERKGKLQERKRPKEKVSREQITEKEKLKIFSTENLSPYYLSSFVFLTMT